VKGKAQICGPKRVEEGVRYSFRAPRFGAKVYHTDSWGIPALKIVPANGGSHRSSREGRCAVSNA
jgi:hypothetical protein